MVLPIRLACARRLWTTLYSVFPLYLNEIPLADLFLVGYNEYSDADVF
jgi:hypothetical protein